MNEHVMKWNNRLLIGEAQGRFTYDCILQYQLVDDVHLSR